ncbi:MAG: hypothetical protein ACUVWP_06805 [bacterium]
MTLKDILYSLIEDGPLREVIIVDGDGFMIENVGEPSYGDNSYTSAIIRDMYQDIKKITTLKERSLPIQGIFETTKGLIIVSFFPGNFTFFGVSKDNIKIKDVWNALSKEYKNIANALL